MFSKLTTEIMKQNYNEINVPDVFKISLLIFMKEKNFQFKNIHITQLEKHAYRLTVDNFDMIGLNSTNIIVNNILKYDPKDLRPFVLSTINEWIKEGNGILLFEGEYLSSNVDILSDEEISTLNHLSTTIVKKMYNSNIVRDKLEKDIQETLNSGTLKFDTLEYYKELNKTVYKSRSLENHKYCFCCNNDKLEDLYGVPINIFNDEELKGLDYE